MTNERFTGYVIRGHRLYWNMLGNMRGIQNRTGDVNWLSGDVSCAYDVRFSGPDYEKEAAELAGRMKAGEIPGRLVITPGSAPPGADIYSPFLSHSGFTSGTDYGMVKELSAGRIAPAPPKQFDLFRVGETHQLKMSGAILNSAFEYDLFSFGHYLDAFNDPRVRFYMAEYNGIPAGACMSVLGDDFLEIAWVGTLAGYRKKGIAGYLIGLAEQDAVLNGRRISVLTAFPGGVNAYSRIGYEKCCEFKVICYDPGKLED
ncbi:MAG: GNAT family N-acetyltransferase [Oscillospiraceae bacterium]|jgi:GNAT superfamily N-acetyltransferase|nr:GNAT family N-acetyltransferase [Oscillospiraceae bacterium]